jgi:hypothetical protein
MTLELQLVDCNCNDCFFMQRDLERFNQSLAFHEKIQKESFDKQIKRLQKAADYQKFVKNDLEKWNKILNQKEKLRFVFDKSAARIQYGRCTKFDKEVSFIPNQCQLETQHCFEHRKLKL